MIVDNVLLTVDVLSVVVHVENELAYTYVKRSNCVVLSPSTNEVSAS